MRIRLWTVPVTDQERARAFYTDALGFGVREDAPWGEGMRWLEVGGADGEPGLVLANWFPPLPADFVLGTLGTDDVRADEERLRAVGVQVEGGVFGGPGGSFLKVRDPDGNAWFLHQPGEEGG